MEMSDVSERFISVLFEDKDNGILRVLLVLRF